jgi:hypothetical protein
MKSSAAPWLWINPKMLITIEWMAILADSRSARSVQRSQMIKIMQDSWCCMGILPIEPKVILCRRILEQCAHVTNVTCSGMSTQTDAAASPRSRSSCIRFSTIAGRCGPTLLDEDFAM